MQKKKKFNLWLWDVVDINLFNNTLDENLKEGFASDISYKILKASRGGNLEVEATFTLEK